MGSFTGWSPTTMRRDKTGERGLGGALVENLHIVIARRHIHVERAVFSGGGKVRRIDHAE